MFIFENLEVYKKSMILSEKVLNTTKNVKNRSINDQLSRAVLSIPLNIAEGQGRMHPREKKQFYNTAKGSLYECLPLIQICRTLNYLDAKEYEEIYELMNGIGRMLSGLIKSVKEN